MIELTNAEVDRIFNKISIDEMTGCWNWTGAKNRGYGAFNYRGKTAKIHRLLYEVFIGDLPKYDGINVLDHVVCDNPGCCNPKHVKLVEQKYNVLRANSISGIHSRKTHCINGHLLPEPKEEIPGSGELTRRCITCRRANRMCRYYKNKELLCNMI
jgi:hypothetical protein